MEQPEEAPPVHRSHRSLIEMRAAVLRATRVESGPTRIMCRANISWRLLKQFIPGMMAKGLIFENTVDGRKSYSLTPKGNQALRLFDMAFQELSESSDPKAWTIDGEDMAPITEGMPIELLTRSAF